MDLATVTYSASVTVWVHMTSVFRIVLAVVMLSPHTALPPDMNKAVGLM